MDCCCSHVCTILLIVLASLCYGSGSPFQGVIVMRHLPLQEVVNSSETLKKERLFEEQLATEENNDKVLENKTESCISRKVSFFFSLSVYNSDV